MTRESQGGGQVANRAWQLAALGLLLSLSCIAIGAIHAGSDDSQRRAAARLDRDIGVTTVPVDAELARTLGLPSDESGLVVTSTASRRARVLRPGDVIEEVNGRPVEDASTALLFLNRAAADNDLLINQKGSHRRLHLHVAARPKSSKLAKSSKLIARSERR